MSTYRGTRRACDNLEHGAKHGLYVLLALAVIFVIVVGSLVSATYVARPNVDNIQPTPAPTTVGGHVQGEAHR